MVGSASTPNTGLSDLFQHIYAAMHVVSRELIGFIPKVSRDASAEEVTLNQPIRVPVVPALEAEDIQANNISMTGRGHDTDFVDVTITKQRKVAFHITAEEARGLNSGGTMGDITMQRFAQAFRTIANEVEQDLANQYVYATAGAYGTPGTTPFMDTDELDDASETMKLLDDAGAPKTGRCLVLNTAANASLLGRQPALFRVDAAGGDMARTYGMLSPMFGFDFGVSGQLGTHARATAVAMTVNNNGGYGVGDSEINFDAGSAAEDIARGDLVSIAGDSTFHFAELDGATSGTLSLLTRGGLKSAVPDDAAITTHATAYRPSVAFTKDAIQLVARVPAVAPGGDMAVDRSYIQDPNSGLIFEVAIYPQYRQVSYEVGLCWGVRTIKGDHMAILLG